MIARVLYYLSFVAIAAGVSVQGVAMWRDAHRRIVHRPAATILVPAETPGGKPDVIVLADDRLTVTRTGAHAWVASLGSTATTALMVAPPLVLARESRAVVALTLATGAREFRYELPADESWPSQRPLLAGRCLIVMGLRGDDAQVHCVDPGTWSTRWTASLPGGRDCATELRVVRADYLARCPGWVTLIAASDGSTTVEAGGLDLALAEPPTLLRARGYLELAPWDPAHARFAPEGTAVRGTDLVAPSAVLRGDHLLVRVSSSSDIIAIGGPRTGTAAVITAAGLHAADDAPFVADCGRGTAPRFQLMPLALAGAFDPDRAEQRTFGLLDTDRAALAWTGRPFVPLRHARAVASARPPLCRDGYYVVPITARSPDASTRSLLWIVDAEAGTTRAVLAAAPGAPSFDELTEDQLSAGHIAVLGAERALVVDWTSATALAAASLGDGRAELTALLGPLP